MRCLWCHNPESQNPSPELLFYREKCTGCGACRSACEKAFSPSCTHCGKCAAVCPSGARVLCGEKTDSERVMETIRRDVSFYQSSGGGVTVSGGEPLAQPAFAYALLAACKAEGIHTACESAGCVEREILARMLPVTDLFLYDLKAFDSALHRKLTGIGNEQILDNAEFLRASGANVVFRMPYIPGCNDGELAVLAAFAAPNPLELLPYHAICAGKYAALGREFQTAEISAPATDEMRRVAALYSNVFCHA